MAFLGLMRQGRGTFHFVERVTAFGSRVRPPHRFSVADHPLKGCFASSDTVNNALDLTIHCPITPPIHYRVCGDADRITQHSSGFRVCFLCNFKAMKFADSTTKLPLRRRRFMAACRMYALLLRRWNKSPPCCLNVWRSATHINHT